MPKARVSKRHNLTVARQIFHRLMFQNDVARNVIENFRVHDHVARVNPADVLLALFAEGKHLVAVEVEIAETTFGLDGGYRANFSVRFVKFQKLVDVHVGEPVAVSEEKIFVVNVRLNFFDSFAGKGIVARVDDRDFPRLGKVVVDANSIFAAKVKRHVAVVERVFGEKTFYHVLFVARADDELVESEMRIFLHYVPENRFAADLNHRFRDNLRLFADSRAEAARQNYDLQKDHLIGLRLIFLVQNALRRKEKVYSRLSKFESAR